MGKVKDEAPATKTTKAPAKGSSVGLFRAFLANFFRGDLYKPAQGWYARLWTGIGLSVLIFAGIWRFYQIRLDDPDRFSPPVRFGVPTLLAIAFGWMIYRIVHFPPFVDFLVATEAEMNKVSWTTKEELKRATVVVLGTVTVLAVYLLGVDLVWQFLLKLIGVLQFQSTEFGSQVG